MARREKIALSGIATFVALLLFSCPARAALSTNPYGWTVNVSPSDTDEQTQSPNQLSTSPPSIDFGNVTMGNTVNQSLNLSNSTGAPVTLGVVTTSGSGVLISGLYSGLVLQNGETVSGSAIFSPTFAGNAAGTILIFSDASGPPTIVSWTAIGSLPPGTTAAGSVQLTPSSPNLVFANVAPGSTNTQSFTLTNTSNSAANLIYASLVGPDIGVAGLSAGISWAPGESITVTAIFSPSSMENVSGTILIFTDAADYPVAVPWTGNSVPAAASGTEEAPSVALVWDASASSGVVGYNVYRGVVSGGPYNLIIPSATAATAYVDPSVLSGQTYYYVITSVAVNSTESGYSSEVAAAVP